MYYLIAAAAAEPSFGEKVWEQVETPLVGVIVLALGTGLAFLTKFLLALRDRIERAAENGDRAANKSDANSEKLTQLTNMMTTNHGKRPGEHLESIYDVMDIVARIEEKVDTQAETQKKGIATLGVVVGEVAKVKARLSEVEETQRHTLAASAEGNVVKVEEQNLLEQIAAEVVKDPSPRRAPLCTNRDCDGTCGKRHVDPRA